MLRSAASATVQGPKIYKPGLYGASDHVAQGYHTWATPDGRKTGDALADATSPAQGRDTQGPIAVLNSACCFDHSLYMDGIALNLRIHPSAVRGEDGINKLRDMTKAYFENNGMEVQYNIVSAENHESRPRRPADLQRFGGSYRRLLGILRRAW